MMNKKLFKQAAEIKEMASQLYEMKEMAAQLQIAQQENEDLKLQSAMDKEQFAKFDAEIQDLRKKNEAMAKKIETMEKINEEK